MASRPIARTLFGLLLGVTVAACGSTSESPTPVVTGEPPTDRIPVIVDADFDLSDIGALIVLLRDPRVDVRAITIAGTGLVHCQAGRLVTRYLMDELGSPTIPFGCGREAGGPDAHPFPDAWRAQADDAFGLDIPPQAEAGVPRDAVDVIKEAVDASPSAPTIVTLGPLTNIEDAFTADPSLADRVAGIHAMLGTVNAPGNVMVNGMTAADPLEWNAYADPSAAQSVFATDVPISIVPLDATDDVPVPADLADRLATDHRAGGADLVYETLVRNPGRMNAAEGQQLWDELAALVLTEPDLVTWEDASVTVGGDDGRLIQDDAGRPVRYAATADQPAVLDAFLADLRQGDPRATPFQLTGSLAITFDGTTCSLQGNSDGPGVHELRYQGPNGTPSGAVVVGVQAPHDWQDVLALSKTYDVEKAPPDWLLLGPMANDDQGTGAPSQATGDVKDGFYGPICLSGTWPKITLVPGAPFATGVGAIGS
jgi:inosine-uridine nucleoside N-ribohydrolase